MKQLFSLFFLFVFISGLAFAQAGDSEETLIEQEKALVREQSPSVDPASLISYSLRGVSNPLFVGVDNVTVPAYQIDPLTNDTISAFVGAEVWGAAYDNINDKIYFNAGITLYEWPVGSGSITMLGTITDTSGANKSMVGLAFYNGVLYGTTNIAPEAVYEINTTTYVASIHIDYDDADFDFGGFSADPNNGDFYGTSDDTSPLGSGLYRINPNGTGTLITAYPSGQTDIDGLAVSDNGIAYLVIDQPGNIYVYDLIGGTYLSPLIAPWCTSEIFSAGAWNAGIIPVELTSFSASVSGNNVRLLWETATELNNSGFSIERKTANSEFTEIGFVPGFGTTTERKSYSYNDQDLRSGIYTYRLKQIDLNGTYEYYGNVEVEVTVPSEFNLNQNYPNPFNPSTKITFSLAVDSKVSLRLFNVLGQEVATLINKDLTAGIHEYNFDATGINSGVYFYKIETTGINGNEFIDIKKMILAK
jgi:hypothetical protein